MKMTGCFLRFEPRLTSDYVTLTSLQVPVLLQPSQLALLGRHTHGRQPTIVPFRLELGLETRVQGSGLCLVGVKKQHFTSPLIFQVCTPLVTLCLL